LTFFVKFSKKISRCLNPGIEPISGRINEVISIIKIEF
jgi:hypothetical protein